MAMFEAPLKFTYDFGTEQGRGLAQNADDSTNGLKDSDSNKG